MRSYKIQEVIKRRQIILVQVVKRSAAARAQPSPPICRCRRYTVLMPNTGRGGGISRKITQPQDRKRLGDRHRARGAGGHGAHRPHRRAARTRQEIKRDFEYRCGCGRMCAI
jgi:ribonuclease E